MRLPLRVVLPLIATIGLLGVAGATWWACGGVSRNFNTAQSASTLTFAGLLDRYVAEDGSVDYARWHASPADVAALDAHLARITAMSPDSHGEHFDSEASKLSYWLNLYNALVLREVLRHWPIDSVHDIRPGALSFIKDGKGFFYDTTYVVGGREVNLLDIENEIIRARFGDARIHFALNCASASCPVLGSQIYREGELDKQLDVATRAFINDNKNVRVDAAARTLSLSKIFEWYSEDFVAHARGKSERSDAGLIDFLTLHAAAPLREQLEGARAFEIVFLEYDWRVNGGASTKGSARSPSSTRGVGEELPPLSPRLLDGSTFDAGAAAGKILIVEFWATYCAPCRDALPKLQTLAKKHADEVKVLTISLDEGDGPVRDFLATAGLTLPVALDVGGVLSARFGVDRLPTTLMVDRAGTVVLRESTGAVAAVENKLKELL